MHFGSRHGLPLGAELPICQRLTQGWRLLLDVQRDVLVSFVLHVEPLYDLHLVTLLLSGLPRSCFYFLISLLREEQS